MKVIFTQSVPGVAVKGDVKNVRGGFFRNYLLPYNKAVLGTATLLKQWEGRRQKMLIEKQELKGKIEETMRRLGSAKVRVEKKITAKGTLYGGVKALDIVKAVKDQLSLDVPEEAVVLKSAIKTVGAYELTLNLGDGVTANLQLEVAEHARSKA